MPDKYGRDKIANIGAFDNPKLYKATLKANYENDQRIMRTLAEAILRNENNKDFAIEFIMWKSRRPDAGERGPTNDLLVQVVNADMGPNFEQEQEDRRRAAQERAAQNPRQREPERPAPSRPARAEEPLPSNDDDLPF